ncbi:23S rRNA (adenine(2030)-N(6))-methyltransferase RlmJ [Aestuariibius sp. HNIBRBA575]|uniref:23S rRNA (adenine(2030)-N(6))-methyltransferase RlmJ n=1 Tax=Aestuariibius sp. HNIBRBA575 TaxID=3233343 RepID=UPI0034A41060
MLSYQHIFHAGNLADVQKHSLLAWMLDYLTQKPKPVSYIETHAGRGLYHLDAAEAVKTGEAAAGIAVAEDWFDADHPYMRALDFIRNARGETAYPGSPAVAASLLRGDDPMHLAELHPRERDALQDVMGRRAKVYAQDGFSMAHAICPPDPRRGLMLIDPSYEVKSDYVRMPGIITQLHRKWNVGVIALWYPILTDGPHQSMIKTLLAEDLPKVVHHEVRFPPAREGHRMIGSGMFVVNAPWGLSDEATRISALFDAAFGANGAA